MYSRTEYLRPEPQQILNNDRNNNLPFVNISTKNSPYTNHFRGYLDSGANISLLHKNLYDKLKTNLNTDEIVSFSLADNNTSAKTIGSTILRIPQLAGPKQYFKFHVVTNLPVACLIGYDILQFFNADFYKQKLLYKSHSIPILHDLPSVSSSNFVHFADGYKTLNSDLKKQCLGLDNPHFLDFRSGSIQKIENGKIGITKHELENFGIDPEINDDNLIGQIINIDKASVNQILKDNPQHVVPDLSFQVKHIQDVDINPDIPNFYRKKYVELIKRFEHIFIYSMNDIGLYKGGEEYSITLTSSKAVTAPTYRIPTHLQENFRNHISQLLSNGLIEPCHSSKYNHGMIPVMKKDKTIRWASDMRQLNAITQDDSYTLPLLEPILKQMIGNSVFSAVDIFSCFNQFKIKESNRDIFGFQCPLSGNRYRWTRCFFGLKNIPSYVSRIMATKVMQNKDPNEASVYIDDLSLYNKNHELHLQNLEDIFSRLDFFGLKLKSSKCHFGYNHIVQFGYRVNEAGMCIDPSRALKLQEIEEPKTRKQLHTALGGIGYFRSSIPNLAKYTSVLTPLLTATGPFDWQEKHKQAWQGMLLAVKNSILHAKPDFSHKFIVTTDASNLHFGGLLSQEIENKKNVLAVHSAHFSPNQTNWSINVKELLGLVKLCEKWEHELIGKKFIVRTDSSWVYFLLKNSRDIYYRKPGPVVRLLMRLSRFDFDIEHEKGVSGKLQLADLMSRLNATPIFLDHRCVGDILYSKDPYPEVKGKTVMLALPKIHSREMIRNFVQESQEQFKDEILSKYQRRPGFDKTNLSINKKLIVPSDIIPKVLKMCHSHYGRNREVRQIKNCDLHWDGMYQDIFDFCSACKNCSQVRKIKKADNPNVHPKCPTRPFQSVAIDILQIGQGPEACYILGLVCHLTNFLKISRIPSLRLEDSMNQIMSWVLEFNISEASLRADNAFRKNELVEAMNVINVHCRFGVPYNSRSNADIERKFRSVLETLRLHAFNDTKSEDFDVQLKFCEALINATPLREEQIAPFECVFGFTPKMLLLEPLPAHVSRNLLSFAKKQYSRLLELSQKMQDHYSRKSDFNTVTPVSHLHKVGDKVRIQVNQPRGANKIQHLPYSKEVYTIREIRKLTRSYLLELTRENRQPLRILCHHRRVKKIFDGPPVQIETIPPVQNETPHNDSSSAVQDQVHSQPEPEQDNIIQDNTRTRTGRISLKPRYLDDYA